MARRKKAASAAVDTRQAVPVAGAVPSSGRLPTLGRVSLGLALITLALYAPALWFDFVNYDDTLFVTENPRMAGGFSRANLIWAFTNNDAFLWHPLTWLSHLLDYQLYGLKAAGHHLTSILIHAASTVLLFQVLARMTRTLWPAAAVAALFAWHPLHVESVAWVAERKDVLSCFFWMLTLWCYSRYLEKPGPGRYVSMLVAFALGLISKPMVVTLPCVMLLLDVWPLKRLQFFNDEGRFTIPWRGLGRLLFEKVPLFILIGVVSVVTVKVMSSAGVLKSTTAFPLDVRVANSLISYTLYFRDVFWPVNLAIFYPFAQSFPAWQVICAALVLLAVTGLVLRCLHGQPFLAVGWFWFLGTLVPVIGLMQNGDQARADRYTYIPYVGIFIALVWGVLALAERFPRLANGVRPATSAILAGCLVLTTLQLQHWRNTVTLFSHALQVTEANFTAHAIFGDALVEQNKLAEGEAQYRLALRIYPRLYKTRQNLANVLHWQKKDAEAIAVLRETLSFKPDVISYMLLAPILSANGQLSEAADAYRDVLKLQPNQPEALVGLGTALVNLGQAAEAIANYRKALQFLPNNAEAHAGLGTGLALLGQLPEAEAELKRAIALHDGPETRNSLGNVLVLSSRGTEAIPHYRAALQLKPDWEPPMNSLAWLLSSHPDAKVRNGTEAVKLAQRACEITRNENPIYLNTLAAAYAENGRFPDAINTAQLAFRLAAATNRPDVASVVNRCLEFYRTNQPYREAMQ